MLRPLTTKTLILFTFLLASGCSASQDSVGIVAGKITFKGDVYSDCKVAIYSKQTALFRGARVSPKGAYQVKNVPPGDYIFMVLRKPLNLPDNGKPDPPDTSPVPKKIRKRETSDLSVSVVAGETSEMNIELTDQ